MKHKAAVDLAIEQKALGVITLVLTLQPALIARLRDDDRHADVDVRCARPPAPL